MILHYRFVTAAVGLVIGLLILVLVRRDRLHAGYSMWWFSTAVVVMVAGLFPQIVDVVGAYFGIAYPPILPLIIGYCLILIKILTMDMDRSRNEQRVRVLTQRLALYEAQIRHEQTGQKAKKGGAEDQPGPLASSLAELVENGPPDEQTPEEQLPEEQAPQQAPEQLPQRLVEGQAPEDSGQEPVRQVAADQN